MNAETDNAPLNFLSRLILAVTATVGLAAVVCTAPGQAGALNIFHPVATKPGTTLSDAPGIAFRKVKLSREDSCYAVSFDGGQPRGLVCEH